MPSLSEKLFSKEEEKKKKKNEQQTPSSSLGVQPVKAMSSTQPTVEPQPSQPEKKEQTPTIPTAEQIKKNSPGENRKVLYNITGKSLPLRPKYSDINQIIEDFKKEAEDLTNPEERQNFTKQLEQAQQEFKQRRAELRNLKTLGKIIEGLTNIAAGLYGMKHGLPIGAIKTPEIDTKDLEEEALEDFRAKRDQISMAQREEEAARRKRAERQIALTDKIRMLEAQRLRDEEYRKQKAAEQAQKEAEKKGGIDPRKLAKEKYRIMTDKIKAYEQALKYLDDGNEDKAIAAAKKAGDEALEKVAEDGWFSVGRLDDSDARVYLEQRLLEAQRARENAARILTGEDVPEQKIKPEWIEWARQNPDDPRAKRILDLIGE